MRVAAFVIAVVAALLVAGAAAADPPILASVGSQARHPTATFSAPKADHGVIEIATRPDRATDGDFLDENVVAFDIFTDAELQAGRWLNGSQLDPGVYYVMIRADADFDQCYREDGTFDPSCAN